mmetsp:Transcript_13138/g.1922  ORF Transcript_13138/g.1922 Transcript_13138/m.1922 type:complete len:80 (+) Transcript_13138:76-315(+)
MIWTIYWIVFSVILILSELSNKVVLKYMQFLEGFCGKGTYIIFLGSLMLNEIDKWETYAGIVYIGVGFVYIGFNCINKK